MINVDHIIWSRSRACQLDLLLRSMKDNFVNAGNIFILYKADNEKFNNGYTKVINQNYGLNIKFILETNFEEQVKNILSSEMTADYVLGNSDDNVFIRPTKFMGWDNELIASHSLRLGRTINYCQPANLQMETPKFIRDDSVLMWDWTKSNPRGCWGYPHPIDSNIYKRQYLINLLSNGNFNNPRRMEEHMNTHRDFRKSHMSSFPETKIISIQANDLGQGANIPTVGISLEELNNRFLNGYMLSTKNLYGIQTNACHVLRRYNFDTRRS